jgi:hypothetical protein
MPPDGNDSLYHTKDHEPVRLGLVLNEKIKAHLPSVQVHLVKHILAGLEQGFIDSRNGEGGQAFPVDLGQEFRWQPSLEELAGRTAQRQDLAEDAVMSLAGLGWLACLLGMKKSSHYRSSRQATFGK